MWAQVLKVTGNKVNLIGDESVGLPIVHPDVICVDIGERTDVELFMTYNEGTGEFCKEELPKLSPMEQRELEYQTRRYKDDDSDLLPWEGKALTVDEANMKYLQYFAEGSSKATEMQAIIVSAKTYIRELYPDVSEV